MTIINEDFFNNKLEDNLVDLIVTDPPYLIGYKEWDQTDINDFHEEWLSEAFRILKPGGTIWSFMAYCDKSGEVPISYGFYGNMIYVGFEVDLRNTVVWARQKGRGASKHLKSQREDIFYATKPGGEKTWHPLKMLREVVTPYVKDGKPRGWFLDEFGNRVRWTGLGNVWTYTAPQWNHKAEKQFHPAQKPVMLLDRLIRLSSNPGDVVLDPFMGSGSTGIACNLNDRNFIGIEKDKEIYGIAEKRFSEFDKEKFKGYSIEYKE
jgi:adenine-specific DNA-methyltransferase